MKTYDNETNGKKSFLFIYLFIGRSFICAYAVMRKNTLRSIRLAKQELSNHNDKQKKELCYYTTFYMNLNWIRI